MRLEFVRRDDKLLAVVRRQLEHVALNAAADAHLEVKLSERAAEGAPALHHRLGLARLHLLLDRLVDAQFFLHDSRHTAFGLHADSAGPCMQVRLRRRDLLLAPVLRVPVLRLVRAAHLAPLRLLDCESRLFVFDGAKRELHPVARYR